MAAYDQAFAIDLPLCYATKLGLALSYSAFFYEVMNERAKACEIADKALTESLSMIDEAEGDELRDIKSITEMLK